MSELEKATYDRGFYNGIREARQIFAKHLNVSTSTDEIKWDNVSKTEILSEREKQDFGEKQAKVYGFGSVKQWRTVMMIETNLGYKFNGSNYWDLKDFISKYFESTERKEIQDEK